MDPPRVVYSDHCALFVPEAVPTERQASLSPLSGFHKGYYVDNEEEQGGSSGTSEWSPNGIRFVTLHVHETDVKSVLNVKAQVVIWLQSVNYLREEDFGRETLALTRFPRGSRVSFQMEGFWSGYSGRLCMVGPTSSKRRHLVDLRAVLKLNNVGTTANITSLFSGTLASLNSPDYKGYFKELPIIIFPMMNYDYVSDHGSSGGGGRTDLPRGLPLRKNTFCPDLRMIGRKFHIKYNPHCEAVSGCEIFKGSPGFLPRVMLLDEIHCSEEERKLRLLLNFVNTSFESFRWHYRLNRMLVGEGRWDDATKRLKIVACRFTTQGSASAVKVEDCNTNLEILFPAVWSIQNSYSMMGRIWRTRTQDDPGYQYTEAERVHNLCPAGIAEKEKNIYPSGSSPDLRFQVKVTNSQGRVAYGNFDPLFFGNQFFGNNATSNDSPSKQSTNESDDFAMKRGMFNISYSIRVPRHITEESDATGMSTWGAEELRLTAEGVYDMNTGTVCMIGCRTIASISGTNPQEDVDPLDCEILIRIRFPPVNLARKGNYIGGTIESMRAQTDPLYFKTLNVSSNKLYMEEARKFIWRTDAEFLLALASNTFTGLFVVKQIQLTKQNREAARLTSLFMLLILSLSNVLPLMFAIRKWLPERDNLQDILLMCSRLIGPSEVVLTTVTTFAFLLQLRLLQLNWSTKATRTTEKKMLIILLPIYVTGALLTIALHWGIPRPIHVGLKFYTELVLDGFLAPQILLNILANSKQKALSSYFYSGISVIRLLPHARYIHSSRHYYLSERFLEYHMIDIPEEHNLFFKLIAGEIMSCLGIIALAVIVHCQQRFGGTCVIPERFRIHKRELVPADEEFQLT
ncbi:hypothetical protein MLD38_031423 [Melastoma candidum]|uniref:Uncharacterized protein n=1 Tax=Melastoma candidum TaxID=119954 RepID=A0ACB9MQV1_9MYRT|nr:hypothetical protein MLD38_031423 [Melastoma candidum]